RTGSQHAAPASVEGAKSGGEISTHAPSAVPVRGVDAAHLAVGAGTVRARRRNAKAAETALPNDRVPAPGTWTNLTIASGEELGNQASAPTKAARTLPCPGDEGGGPKRDFKQAQ